MKNCFSTAMVLLAVLTSVHAQKMAKAPVGFSFFIEPLKELPTEVTTYTSEINSPLEAISKWNQFSLYDVDDPSEVKKQKVKDGLRREKEKLATQYLKIQLSRLAPSKVNGDFKILLETSAVDASFVNQEPFANLQPDDIVARYSYSAKVKIIKPDGTVIFEQWVHEDEKDQKFTKKRLMFNLAFKARISAAKNNPERQTKIVQRKLESRGVDVLMVALKNANKAINNEYGRRKVKGNMGIFSVKGKAYGDIQDTQKSLVTAFRGLAALSKKKRWTKDQVDEAMKSALPIWENGLAKEAELEEKAVKGLNLNCAFGYAWIGDFDKAREFIAKVPEAFEYGAEDEEDDRPAAAPGTILPLATYAINVKDYIIALSDVDSSRITF